LALRGWIALLALCLGASLALPALAAADTGDVVEPQHEPPTSKDGFQAGTCYENQVEEDPEKTDLTKAFCSAETPGLFFTQAGGHPPFAFDQYIIRHETLVPGVVEPLIEPFEDRVLKTERVDLPPGFTENPQSSPKCSQEDFEAIGEIPGSEGKIGRVPKCDPSTIVGRDETWLVVNTANVVEVAPETFLPRGYVLPPEAARGTRVPVYNLEPDPGEPARLGFIIGFARVIVLEGGVAWENDFHEYFTLHLPEPSVPFSSLRSRLVAFGQSGDGTHVTLPTTCFDPEEQTQLYSTWFRGESWGEPNPTFPEGTTPWEAKQPPGVRTTGCDSVPFDPSIDVAPGTDQVDSPAAATVTTTLPFDPAKEGGEVRDGETEGISQSHVRKAEVTLPSGMGLNPSGSQGLLACTDAQFKKGVRVYENECPAASRVGTATVESAPLAEPLIGDVYVGEQKSMDPTSGEQFRILVEAKSEHEGIVTRLVGHVSADPSTGQLTAAFDEQLVGPFAGTLPRGLPQAPFESVTLSFDKSKAVLTSPPTCSAADTNGAMEPWARPGTTAPVSSTFTLTSDPGGGGCPHALAERRFAPSYSAYSDSTTAGKYSPFWAKIGRDDGQQEIKLVDVTLPPGLSGKLAGVPYCSEAAIAAAAGKAGKAEQASPSCSDASKIGTTTTTAGTGGAPLSLPGNVYLAGPYRGAPLSLAVITPAVSGPFDLGTVVVRVALNVNPVTAQVSAVSDAIPDVYGGVKLDIRRIDFDVDRSQFTINPTNCQRKETKGAIDGGGGNPADPAAWSAYSVSFPFQPVGCKDLKFKPKLYIRLKGRTRRGGFPQLRAVLETRRNDANVARTALNLPRAFFVEQAHMKKVCTRPQFASQTCPGNSIYGYAEAKSPLLDGKLKGRVYLVPSSHTLPDLVADLHGQVNIQLYGVISTKHGGIKTVFNGTPDVPVTKFILNMRGGKRGLIVNSTNICKTRRQAILNIKGHNSRRVKTNHFRLNLASCPQRKAHEQRGGNG
jgi:hypothetical protein